MNHDICFLIQYNSIDVNMGIKMCLWIIPCICFIIYYIFLLYRKNFCCCSRFWHIRH